MKRFKGLLVPMIMVGILVLSGCGVESRSTLRHQPASQINEGLTSAPTLGASFQQTGTIPADKAIVYIYRPGGLAGGLAIPFDVKANGKAVTTLVQGGYYAYLAEPGQIEFTAFDTGFMAPTSIFSITVDAKAGQAYYLKGAHGKGLGGRAHLESVSSEVGANEIVNCKLTTTQ